MKQTLKEVQEDLVAMKEFLEVVGNFIQEQMTE